MAQRWFDRKFQFDYPVEEYVKFSERLRKTPDRLEDLTRGLSREQLTIKPDQTWSIQENAGHMLQLESLWYGRIDDFLAGSNSLTPADLKNRATDEAHYNEQALAHILTAFRRSRRTLTDRLARLAPTDFSRTATHPRLQAPMRLVDHLMFIAEHDDHHLARIQEIRTRLGVPGGSPANLGKNHPPDTARS
jgi:uncharacterized damage-inducible protein DinB